MSRFEVGNPGGPGRPRARIAKFRASLAELTGDGREIAEGLRAIWRDPATPAKERIAAYELALVYLLGKPEASVSIEADLTARPGAVLDMPRVLASLPSGFIDAVCEQLDAGDAPQLPSGPHE